MGCDKQVSDGKREEQAPGRRSDVKRRGTLGGTQKKGVRGTIEGGRSVPAHLSLRLVLVGEFATEETERRHEECRV